MTIHKDVVFCQYHNIIIYCPGFSAEIIKTFTGCVCCLFLHINFTCNGRKMSYVSQSIGARYSCFFYLSLELAFTAKANEHITPTSMKFVHHSPRLYWSRFKLYFIIIFNCGIISMQYHNMYSDDVLHILKTLMPDQNNLSTFRPFTYI